jgi:iron complex outermembrane recepter protein
MLKLSTTLRALFLMLVSIMSYSAFSQNTISGTIKSDKNQPMMAVSVVVKGTAKGTLTDNKGNYTIKNVPAGKQTIVASFVGMKSIQEVIEVKSGDNSLNFTLSDDALELESVIVTGVFDQRTKLESSVAITTLNPKAIEQRAARGTGDLLQAVPGIWADNSSGEVGSKVVARGLAPVGNDQIGFQYLSLQEEGLPVMGAQMGFALVDMFHRNDLNTGRFEAIRGGSAAITSANSPGGIFNFISKTGGAKFAGSAAASVSLYNNSNTLKRFDVEFGGPLTSNGWGYHLGGFYRVDAGARNTPFNANEGGQIKGNITKQFKNGMFKIYGKYLNDQNAFFKEIALKNDLSVGYDAGTGDPVDINNSTTFIDVTADVPLATDYRRDNTANPTRRFDAKSGIQNRNWAIGAELSTELGKGWNLNLKAKHSDIDQTYLQYQGNIVMPVVPSVIRPNNLGYLQFGGGALASPGTYSPGFIAAGLPAATANALAGALANSFVPSLLSPSYYDAKTGELLAKVNFALVNNLPVAVLDPNVPNKLGNFILATAPLNMNNQAKDNIAQMSITKEAGKHQITLGTFYSQTNINTQWFVDGVVSTLGNNPRAIRIEFPAPAALPASVAGVPSLAAAFGPLYGAGKKFNATDPNGILLQSGLAYTVTENKSVLNAYYFNDVIKASDRLNIDLGIRYETVRQTGIKQGWQGGTAAGGGLGALDKNPFTLYDLGSRVYNGQIFNYDQSYTLNPVTNIGTVSNPDASGDGEGFQFDYISWSAGLNYKLSNNTASYLRVSRGNKAPELDYYANNFVNIPLDKKAPIETITQAEVGFKTNSKKASLSATAFYSYLDNALLQLFISNGSASFFTDPTFNATRTIGLELETNLKLTDNFNIKAHATIQDAKYDRLSYQNTAGSVDKTQFFIESFAGNRVKDVAPVILDITPSLRVGKFTPYINYRWFSERQGNRRNSIQLASYGVVNAGVTGDLTSKFSISVQGNNLLNSAGILLFGGYGLQGTSPEDIAVGGIRSPVTNAVLPGTNITELNALGAPVFARPILARQLSVTLSYKF